MRKRCRFCGEAILDGIAECNHCGKTLNAGQAQEKGVSPSDLRSYEQKTVPTWVMLILVGLSLFCVYLMFVQGCEQVEEVENQPVSQLVFSASIAE